MESIPAPLNDEELEVPPIPKVYIPPGAHINVDSQPANAPEPRYKNRKAVFDREAVKKVAGGLYNVTDERVDRTS